MIATTAFSNSVSARCWTTSATADPAFSACLAAHLGCPLPIARLLVTRGLKDGAGAEAFLRPTLDDLHDPSLLLGMPEAVERIQYAVAHEEPILIYGDYDVDGTTATALLKTVIERTATAGHTAQVTYHVPHRIREGYGMQARVLGLAADSGIRLVISVDTGIRAFAAAEEAKLLGLDLIVTDHHLPDDTAGLPEALAVINPAQPGCRYPNKHLCGAGVAFKLAHALLAAHARRQPDPVAAGERLRAVTLPSLLKLVAIATIADAVPLAGENRAIAVLGLRELTQRLQPGLRALMEVSSLSLDRPPTASEVAFRLAPRINAAGRMDVAGDVVELLLTRDHARAQSLAEKLDRLNTERRNTEAKALTAIEQLLAELRARETGLPNDCIILDHADWHRGVLGILASRVVDRTGRPALIMTHQDGSAHGSGRSVPGFHLLDALTAVHQAPEAVSGDGDMDGPGSTASALFTRFGGHAHAVGLTLPSEKMHLLRTRMSSHAALHLTPDLLKPAFTCDIELSLGEISWELYRWIAQLAPFGNGAPEPLFVGCDLTVTCPVRLVKERHICLSLRDTAKADAEPIEALGWSRSVDWVERAKALGLAPGSRVDAVYRLCAAAYRGTERLQLELVHLDHHVEGSQASV